MSVQTDETRTIEMFSRIERIEDVAVSLGDDPRRETLFLVVADELSSADPIRPVIAAKILGLTEKTIRAWAQEGVLTVSATDPRTVLEPTRIHQVLHLVQDLRRAGRTHGLLDEVYRRLTDDELLNRADLQASLAQMRDGQGDVVRSRTSR